MRILRRRLARFGLFTATLSLYASACLSQSCAVKTNGLYWALGSPNAGFEFIASKPASLTLDLFGVYDPITINRNKMLRIAFFQPELRYWFARPFVEHAIGFHLLGGAFNHDFGLRKQGLFWGAGLSYSYSIFLSSRWNLEACVGVGYARLNYNYLYKIDGKPRISESRNYFGPTRVAFHIVYLF